jgi:hypothetical protein
MTPRHRLLARGLAVFAHLAAISLAAAPQVLAQGLPRQISDSTYWRMISEFSEPGGYFRSDNFVSNEGSFQYVIPELQRSTRPGGVYLGVAPDQNFTYLVALRPRIAFIIDIRRQNMLQHLLYKALIEMSDDRAAFLSGLFSRPRPADLDSTSTVEALLQSYDQVVADSALFRSNLAAVTDWLVRQNGFPLSDDDLAAIEYVFRAFLIAGPYTSYSFPGGGGGARFGRSMPSYGQLIMETDGEGAQRSYLASEANYRVLKEMQTDNLVVPLVGDFAGPHALRAVGRYLKERGATVTAFYTSNVEQYLFRQGDDWQRFYSNVATLPIDETSTFIRSLSNGAGFRPGSPNSRSVQLLSSIAELLQAFSDGKILDYDDIIQLSK